MADQTINNMSVTWNSGGTTFDAIKFNVTDTASHVASRLLTLQVGGADKFVVGKDGSLTIAGGLTIGGTFTIGTVDINGGTIDGTAIGGAVPAAAAVTTLAASGASTLAAIVCTTVTASGNITGNSDARLKTDVETIEDALAIVRRIRGVRYTRISDGTRNYGVIAQELLKAGVPEMVREGEDGLLSVDYGSGFGLALEAIKRVTDIIDRQEARIAVLEAR